MGLAVGQLIIYACTPLVSRLYDPSAVGRGGVFLAATNVVGTIAALRFEAQLAASDEAMARWVTVRGAAATALVSVLSIPVWTIISSSLAEGVLFGLTCAAVAAIAFLTQWAARLASMNGVAVSKAVQGITQAGTQVGLGAMGWRGFGMQLGFAAGYIVSACAQFGGVFKHLVQLRRGEVSRHQQRQSWKDALGLTLASALNLGTVWAQLFLLQLLYGNGASGQFTIAQRLAIAPAGLVVAALMPSVVSAAGKHLREGTSPWPVVTRALKGLIPFSLAVNLIIVAIPTSWVVALLGADWVYVKSMLAAMAPLTFGLVAVGPVNQIMAISGHTRTQLVWDFTRALSVFAVGLATYYAGGDGIRMVLTTSVTLFIFYVIYLVLLRNRTQEATR